MPVARYFHPETALLCGQHPAEDAVVRAALAAEIAALGLADLTRPRPVDMVRVISGAMRRLTHQRPLNAERLRLLSAAPPVVRDGPVLALLRCRALQGLAQYELLAAELRRLTDLRPILPARDARLADFAGKLGLGWLLQDRDGLQTLLSGDIPTDPQTWYFPQRAVTGPDSVPQARLDRYCAATGQSLNPPLQTRIAAGALRCSRDRALWRADSIARLIPARTPAEANRHLALHALFDAASRTMVQADLSGVQAAIDGGRNAIVLRAHAGVKLVDMALTQVQATRVMIANGDFSKPGFSTLLVNAAAGSAMGMVKLAKAMRATRHLVLILADGGSGSDFVQAGMDGFQMRIALGAAALARVHPSQFFFARGVQHEGGFMLDIIPGAQIDKDTPREAVQAALVACYTGGIRRILDGAPEDLGELRFIHALTEVDE